MKEVIKKQNLLIKILKQNIEENLSDRFENGKVYLLKRDITPIQLANVLGISELQIVKFFFDNNQKVSSNQTIPEQLVVSYLKKQNIELEFVEGLNLNEVINEYLSLVRRKIEESEESKEFENSVPVVTIMGHIDHGKTTLLDTIRETNVQAKEEGGITQRITVSQIVFSEKEDQKEGRKITFLDTPGHSDFIKMRAQGIKLSDFIVLVIDPNKVGQNDQNKAKSNKVFESQTIEIIDYIKKNSLPAAIFINKRKGPRNIDNLDFIKNGLSDSGILIEEWGGNYPFLVGDAKDPKDARELLELIAFLTFDLSVLKNQPTNGLVIDSHKDPRGGFWITELLIKAGKLTTQEEIFLNGEIFKIKTIRNSSFPKKNVTCAEAGEIVGVTGIKAAAELGDVFVVVQPEIKDELEKLIFEIQTKKIKKFSTPAYLEGEKNLNVVLFSDSRNRLEALRGLIQKINSTFDNNSLSVIFSSASEITNQEVNLIERSEPIVIYFGSSSSVLIKNDVEKTFKQKGIKFIKESIIYNIEEKLKKIVQVHDSSKLDYKEIEVETAKGEILHKFSFSKTGSIAGCKIIEGEIDRNNIVEISRKGVGVITPKKIKIESLQVQKKPVNNARRGNLCGIVLNNFDSFEVGDTVTFYKIQKESAASER